MVTSNDTRSLRSLAAAGDKEARDVLAAMGHKAAIRAAMAITRDNRLWEPEEVEQQVWLYAYEAVDNDKGIGDAVAFYRFHIINRIRDWVGATVRRHAFAVCSKCGNRQAIRSVRERECHSCGAVGSDIESVSIVDRGAEWLDVGVGSDDFSALVVKEFWSSLSDLQQRVLVDRMNGRERVEIAVRQGISMTDVGKVVKSVAKGYEEYAA